MRFRTVLHLLTVLPNSCLVGRWRKRVSGSKNPLARSVMAWAEVLRGKSGEGVVTGDMVHYSVATSSDVIIMIETES